MLCNWAAFNSAIARTDEQQLIKEADEESLEIIQDTHGGSYQSEKCSHTHTHITMCYQNNSTLASICVFK